MGRKGGMGSKGGIGRKGGIGGTDRKVVAAILAHSQRSTPFLHSPSPISSGALTPGTT